jgi:rhomboid protease GluP
MSIPTPVIILAPPFSYLKQLTLSPCLIISLYVSLISLGRFFGKILFLYYNNNKQLSGGYTLFVRTESFQQFIRSYPIVSIILGINILVYLLVVASAPLHLDWMSNFINAGVGYNTGVAQGQWWRLVTPLFLHFSFSHILFNSFSIFLFAPALEVILGKGKFALAYLGSGILSDLLTFVFGGLSFPPYIGSSSAIFGLFGIYLFIIFLRRDMIDHLNRQTIGIILILSLVMTFFSPGIDILGHLFGLLGGFILAPFLLIKTRHL